MQGLLARRLWLPVLAATLVLSGCTSLDNSPSARLPSSASGFLPEVKLPGGSFSAEPNIAVLPDGTLFAAAPGEGSAQPNAVHGAAWLWRSTDHGKTWEALRSPSPQSTPRGNVSTFFSEDVDVAASPDGWVYYSDWWVGPPYLAGGNFLVEASGDGGKTWGSAPITTPDAVTSVDRQWLVAGPDGFVALLYAYYHPVANQVNDLLNAGGRGDYTMSLEVVTSTDHGQTWSQPQAAAGPTAGRELLHGKPVLTAGGTLAFPYVDTSNQYLYDPGTVTVALSNDHGQTWFHRVVATIAQDTGGLWPVQIAADATSKLYVVWNERVHDDIVLRLSTSSDGGETWSSPATIQPTGLNVLPWIAAHADGHVAVGWYGADAHGAPEKAANSTAWFAMAGVSHDGGQSWSFARANATPVKIGPLCTIGSRCPNNQNRELLDYVSMVFDHDGALHYVYTRSYKQGNGKIGMVSYAQVAPM